MKINQIIINEMTAGSVASVAMPIGKVNKRTNETVKTRGLEPVEKIISGRAKKKGPYANSLSEAKKDFAAKLKGKVAKSNKDKKDTEEKVKQHQQPKDKVEEAKLDEDDLIIVPGQTMKRKTGFVPRGQSRVDHEVEMARSDVLATMKNAKAIYELLRNRSEDEGIEGWVQEKLIKANDYLNSVKEYYDEKMVSNEMTGGVVAGGGIGEGIVGGYPFNANDPRNWAKKKAYDNRMAAKAEREANKPAAMPKAPAAPKLTLDDVWRKVEDVVGRIFPDGDPIDYLAPWLEKHGIRDFKIGEILDRAAKKNGYKDLYDYYDSMKDQYASDNVAEGSEEQVYKVVALDKGNALKKPTKLNVKASSIEDVFSRLAVNDWYPLEINGVEVIAGKRLKQGVAEEKVNEKFASQQQAKLMYAVAGDKDVAKKTGVSQSVAKEFIKKSHGQKVGQLPKKVKKD